MMRQSENFSPFQSTHGHFMCVGCRRKNLTCRLRKHTCNQIPPVSAIALPGAVTRTVTPYV
jgi:hypothetical protein